ncbi:MAG: DUF4403 family protein [Deltaproteobacteria bacterium]|nr:DUF4403 family protein [Deltaproteobacteria bacterium]
MSPSVRAILLAGVLPACAHTLQIPRPPDQGPGAPLPPPGPSVVRAPLTAEVQSTLAALQDTVPQRFDTQGQFRMLGPTPVGVRYTVQRGPFQFRAEGTELLAETLLELSAEACLGNPLGIALPFLPSGCQPVASCGVGERPRRVRVRTATSLHLDPSWRIVSQTRALPPAVEDRCELTAFHLDVSDFIAQMVIAEVSRATTRLDTDIASRGDLRPRGERFWRNIQEPVDLGEGFWLSLNPEGVQAGALVLGPEVVTTEVGVTARPFVTTGARPVVAARSLPELSPEGPSGPPGPFQLTFDTAVGFTELTALVAQEFQNRTLDLDGHQVFVLGVRVRGNGQALIFEVDVRFESGPASQETGTVYMAGLPDYDPAQGAMVVRELDFTLETRSVLARVGEWFLRGSLRDALARRATFPLRDRIERMRSSAERALTRDFGDGTRLQGTLATIRPAGAFVTDHGVTVRVLAEGTARVTQDVGALNLVR